MLAIFSWLVLQFRPPSLVALGEGVAGSFPLLQVPDPFQCGRDKLLLFGRRGDVAVVAGGGTLHHSLVKQLSEQEGWVPSVLGLGEVGVGVFPLLHRQGEPRGGRDGDAAALRTLLPCCCRRRCQRIWG